VLEAHPPSAAEAGELNGRADLGSTVGRVRWLIEPARQGSQVTLSAWVDRASFFDRALLALGGRWWLQRIFVSALERLEVAV
jgi:hypothetical protein